MFSCRETLTDCTIQSCVNTVTEKLTYITDMCNVYNLFVHSYFIVLIVKEQILFFFVNLYECDGACVITLFDANEYNNITDCVLCK